MDSAKHDVTEKALSGEGDARPGFLQTGKKHWTPHVAMEKDADELCLV